MARLVDTFPGCMVSSCVRGSCTLIVDKAVRGTIYDCDCLVSLVGWTRSVCDFLIVVPVGKSTIVVAVEMKEGSLQVTKVRAQLEASFELAGQFIPPERVRGILPIVIQHGGTRAEEYRLLGGQQGVLKWSGHRSRIIARRTTASLWEELQKARLVGGR